MAKKKIANTGHDTNLTNCHKLNNLIKAKSDYNPDDTDLTSANFVIQMNEVKNILTDINPHHYAYFKAKADRKAIYEEADILEQRTFEYFTSKKLTPFELKEATHWHSKYNGYRISDIPEIVEGVETGTEKITHSVSQQQFTNKTTFFTNLNNVYVQSGKYTPNDATISEAVITGTLADMRSTNSVVGDLFEPWESLLEQRDKLMYEPVNGLIDTTKRIKRYCASLWKISSPAYYKKINSIRFLNLRRKPKGSNL